MGGAQPLRLGMSNAVRAVTGEVDRIVRAASDEVGVEGSLLEPFVQAALAAAASGRRLETVELAACRRVGADAAERGFTAAATVDLYLSATWRLWEALAVAAPGDGRSLVALGTALFRAADDATSALAEGFEDAQRRAIRREEALHREFVDDLLGGQVAGPHQEDRAARFGFVLSGPHLVLVAVDASGQELSPGRVRLEGELTQRIGSNDVLVTTRGGQLVVVLPGWVQEPVVTVRAVLGHDGSAWRLGVGRVLRGPGGVARSFDQARTALQLVSRARLQVTDAHYDRLAALRLLAHDQQSAEELVDAVLAGLAEARGGAERLVETLEAYFAAGLNISETARMLHVTPRGVSHRFEVIERLTGYSPRDPEDRFSLELAVRTRRLLVDGG